MHKYAPPTFALVIAMTGLSGCASRQERESFDRWFEAEKQVREPSPLTSDATNGHAWEVATEPLAEAAGLEEMVDYALRNNPGLLAKLQEWRASLHRVPQARGIPDPEFFYQRDSLDKENDYGVDQPIPWPTKLDARAEVALQNAQVAEHGFHAARTEVVNRVKQAYAEWVYLGKALALSRQDLELGGNLEQAADALYRGGKTTQADIWRVQIELERIANQLKNLEAMRISVQARLNAALGRPSDAPIPAAHDLPETPYETQSDTLRDTMKLHNPSLAAMERRVGAAEKGIRAARLEGLPDGSVGAMYMDEMGMDGYGLRVGVTLPVYREKYTAMRRQALAEFNAAVHDRLEMLNQLDEKLQRVLYELDDAARREALFGQRLAPKAQSAYEAVLANYGGGRANLNEVIMARRDLLDIQLSHERARADRFQGTAELQMLLGHPHDVPHVASEQP